MTENTITNSETDLDQSEIAFISRRINNSADWELYLMNADGSDQRRLIDKTVGYERLVYSSDGLKIVFSSYNNNNEYELYILNIDGTNLSLLATGSRYCGSAAWKPDGEKIVFAKNRNDASDEKDIHLINIDGSGHTILTATGDNFSPSWSPDGEQIVFSSARDGFSGIYVMKLDGSNLKLLTSADLSFISPYWSSDGQKIVYNSVNYEGTQIYVMNADGSAQKQLTNTVSPIWLDSGFPRDGNHSPVWSPNGSKIAFVSWRDGDPDIFVMDADGSNQKRLTNTDKRDEHPAWSPSGSQIVFTSKRNLEMDAEIFIMNTDGSNQRSISNYTREDVLPMWLPQNYE